jgi:hypothetical protein
MLLLGVEDHQANNVRLMLQATEIPCQPAFWFSVPDCAQIAADTFSVPVAIYGEQSNSYVPLLKPISGPLVVLRLAKHHFNYVKVDPEQRFSLPPLTHMHEVVCKKQGLVEGLKNVEVMREWQI